ncbi:hypothetical protein AB0B04_18940 [Streptomyces xinghaiensis]|uniref:Uncharacterized protein n=2 Tax=Streptomyces TaxID=1883 RepID=A0A3R7HAG5_9ACTN|nr:MULTISPECIES: hypothetical protein [Streptomyces]KNE78786.1 hypothetical protein ADZ36_31230 [Streptomyces fradiae]OFA36644.1 hypothetical protein BEN35_29755 [Streptomyces fradiae]PQM20641.1 hypothetical protein Sfr7A_26000 [Streptomyces xinghaiensis]RKM92582.1 hypothetical protein SFRA_024655 [Streptomyces xinghaiensis]RNC70550.1 hypothetical protein DC095_025645 [Streptomyces xinghaiensis]
MTGIVTVDCGDFERDTGEDLRALDVNDCLDLDGPAAGLPEGTWLLLAHEGEDRAVLRPFTTEETRAARQREESARIYQ